MSGSETDVEKSFVLKDTQARVLPRNKLIIVTCACAFVTFLGFLDQTAVTTAVPTIADDLHIGSSISWVVGSFIASSTSTQLIVGRLSDIFGRKASLVTSLTILMFGDLLTGFAQNEIWLYTCRAISGLGAGSLNSQAQIVLSDVTTLEQRGTLFGIVGVAIALGNGLGPVVGGVLTQNAGWRWTFWIISPLAATVILVLCLVLPGSGRKENIWAKLKMVDWLGVVLTLAGTFLVLIPISQGGSAFPFDSAQFIALLTIGVVLFMVFIYVEMKWAKLPVIPMHLFTTGYAANSFLWQNIGYGWVFWGNIYFTPVYFQNVRGYSPSRSGVLILPLVVAHGLNSAISGNLISRSGRYLWSILLGTGLWTIGLACQAAFYNQETTTLSVALIGVFEGIGVGFCFQPNLIGLLANSYKADRAVATALRAFLRALGGAIGIAVGNAILNNTLKSGLQGVVSSDILSMLASSTSDLGKFDLDESQQETVRQVYMRGIHIIFITFAPIIGACFLSTLPIRDRGLQQLDERKKDPESTQVESEGSNAVVEVQQQRK